MRRVTEPWAVTYYSFIDTAFGYDAGVQVLMRGLEPAVAKSIARHKNKTGEKYGVAYYAEEESQVAERKRGWR